MAKALPLSCPPKSICILRLSALGDVTHVVPLVHTIRSHWPRTSITWIIGSFEHKLVGDLSGVEFIVYRKKSGLASHRDLVRALLGRHFDVLLNLQVAFRANLLSSLVKADIRLGYDAQRAKDLHRLFINHRIPAHRGQHVLDCFFSFLEVLGLSSRTLSWQIPIPEEARAFARLHLPQDRPNLIISPCSSHSLRNWSVQGYAQVADYAAQRWGMRVILCGGPTESEREMALSIQDAAQSPLVNLVGKDTIKQLLALLERADLVISPDSGPAHMASAVNTPVIGLYAASNPARSGPYRHLDWCVDAYSRAAQQCLHKSGQQLKWGKKLEYKGVMDLIESSEVMALIDRWGREARGR